MFEELLRSAYFAGHLESARDALCAALAQAVHAPPDLAFCFSDDFFDRLMGIFLTNNQVRYFSLCTSLFFKRSSSNSQSKLLKCRNSLSLRCFYYLTVESACLITELINSNSKGYFRSL